MADNEFSAIHNDYKKLLEDKYYGKIIKYEKGKDLSLLKQLPQRNEFVNKKFQNVIEKHIKEKKKIAFLPNTVLERTNNWKYELILFGILFSGEKAVVVINDVEPSFAIKIPKCYQRKFSKKQTPEEFISHIKQKMTQECQNPDFENFEILMKQFEQTDENIARLNNIHKTTNEMFKQLIEERLSELGRSESKYNHKNLTKTEVIYRKCFDHDQLLDGPDPYLVLSFQNAFSRTHALNYFAPSNSKIKLPIFTIEGSLEDDGNLKQHRFKTVSNDRSNYYLKLFRENLCSTGSWNYITNYSVDKSKEEYHCDKVFYISQKNMSPINLDKENETMKKLYLKDKTMVVGWDIETLPLDMDHISSADDSVKKVFVPDPKTKRKKISDICFLDCMSFHWYNEDEPLITVALTCIPQPARRDCLIIKCATQEEIIKVKALLIHNMMPEIISDFNGGIFDWPFLLERVREAYPHLEEYMCSYMSLLKTNGRDDNIKNYIIGKSDRLLNRTEQIKLDADTKVDNRIFELPGYLCVDTRTVFRKMMPNAEESNLNFYLKKCKLDSKVDMPYHEMWIATFMISDIENWIKTYNHLSKWNPENFNCYEDVLKYIFDNNLQKKVFIRAHDEHLRVYNCKIDHSVNELTFNDVLYFLRINSKIVYYCNEDANKCSLLLKAKNVIMDTREVVGMSYTSVRDGFFRAGGMKVRNMTMAYGNKPEFGIIFDVAKKNTPYLDEKGDKVKYSGAYVFPPEKECYRFNIMDKEKNGILDENIQKLKQEFDDNQKSTKDWCISKDQLNDLMSEKEQNSQSSFSKNDFNITPVKLDKIIEEYPEIEQDSISTDITKLTNNFVSNELKELVGKETSGKETSGKLNSGKETDGKLNSNEFNFLNLDTADYRIKKYLKHFMKLNSHLIEMLSIGNGLMINPLLLNDVPMEGLDFSSLYPSIMRARNLSPEKLIKKKHLPMYQHLKIKYFEHTYIFGGQERTCYFTSYVPIEIPNKKPAFKLDQLEIDKAKTMLRDLPNDMVDQLLSLKKFRYEHLGLYPYIEDNMFNERAELKKPYAHYCELIEEAKAKGEKVNTDWIVSRDYAYTKQNGRKTFMNTYYGECGNQISPFFQIDLAASITSFGQILIKFVKSLVKKWFFGVQYGDTDSCYAHLPQFYYVDLHIKYELSLKMATDRMNYWRELIARTFKVLPRYLFKINYALQLFTGCDFLKMAYEEVLWPYALFAKKKYCGIPHESKIQLPCIDVDSNVDDFKTVLFIKGLEMKKRGCSEFEQIISWEVLYGFFHIKNNRPLHRIVEDTLHELKYREYATDIFAKKKKYNPNKQNVALKTFVERMRERGERVPYPMERISIVFVKTNPYYFDVRGRKKDVSAGDRMEYLDVVKENPDKFEIDIDNYFESGLIGILARFITYQNQFLPSEPESEFENFKEYDAKTMDNAKKYIKELYQEHKEYYINPGTAHKKIYQSIDKSIIAVAKTKIGGDKIKEDLFKTTAGFITSYEPPKTVKSKTGTFEAELFKKLEEKADKQIKKSIKDENYAQNYIHYELYCLTQEMNGKYIDEDDPRNPNGNCYDPHSDPYYSEFLADDDDEKSNENPNNKSSNMKKATIYDFWTKFYVGPQCVEKKKMPAIENHLLIYKKQMIDIIKKYRKEMDKQYEMLESAVIKTRKNFNIDNVNNIREEDLNILVDMWSTLNPIEFMNEANLSVDDVYNKQLDNFNEELTKAYNNYFKVKTIIENFNAVKQFAIMEKRRKANNYELPKQVRNQVAEDFDNFLKNLK